MLAIEDDTSTIRFRLHPKQSRAFNTKATEILYGGAAGGAKSHLMRVVAIALAVAVPGLQIYLFRRVREDLIKNHMEGPTGFRAMLASWLGAECNVIGDDEIRWDNGSRIYLCHCQHERDRFKYQGAEIHVLLIDELTHFTEVIYRFLRSRVRIPATLEIPDEFNGLLPRILCASNPGGIGHQWVRSTWIDPKPSYEIWRTSDEEGGFKRQYIPAKLEDNPSLDQGQYASNLAGLGNPELVKAMLDGDWDVVAGAALDIARDRHMLPSFPIPNHWVKFMVVDWGYVRPFSVGWYCVVDGVQRICDEGTGEEYWIPNGALIRYRELYGWGGKPDVGMRMESPELVERILEIEDEAQETMDYRVADTGIWAKNDGMSIFERMYNAAKGEDGFSRFNPRKSEKDRQASYSEICTRLKGEEQEGGDYWPMLFVTDNCRHFWRTVPPLVLDDLHPERGPDEDQENHVWDEVCYAAMSRPYIRTKHQRTRQEFFNRRQKYISDYADPYQLKPRKKR